VESRHDALVLPDGVFKNGSSGAKYANSLADYRYLYKKYRTDTRLQALHERFAFIAIWDDHEFTDDAWQDAQTYDGSFNADGSDLHQTRRRRARRGLNSCRPTSRSRQCQLPEHQDLPRFPVR
jgi:alkaline phosphatase D